MVIVYVMLIISFFEVRHLIKTREKKEASIYIAIIVLTIPIALYVSLTPKFVSFAEIVFGLLGIAY